MSVYDGNKLAREALLDVAKLCAAAALKAPQITGKTEIKTLIITGEDLEPIIEALMVLGRLEMFNMLSYLCWKNLYDQGRPPVLLLIGTKVRASDLNYNCGGCGFLTCAEFNRYTKTVEPNPRLMIRGPACQWKIMDFAIACDWAAAAAWQYNITNRVEIATGMAASALGYLPDCDVVMGLPVGPNEDLYWYSRDVLTYMLPHEMWHERTIKDFPTLFATFPGNGRQELKLTEKWWKQPYVRSYQAKSFEEMEQLREGIDKDLAELREKWKERIQKLNNNN